MFLVAALGLWWTDGLASDFPSRLAAVATLAALVAAVFAARYAGRAYELEFQRERRWEEGQRAQQASLLAAWFGTVTRTYDRTVIAGVGTGSTRKEARKSPGVFLRNASDLPVHEVVYSLEVVTRPPDNPGFVREPLGGPRVHGLLPPAADPVGVPLQGEQGDAFNNFDAYMDSREGEHSQYTIDVSITFRDSLGRRWARWSDEPWR